ncbi:MAG: HlyD family secretion protein [Bacteroidia bacterium]|nr:HlyD family secretion protein [Bacteroidia bacterium]MCX7652893.1 HlyD family secretion protein [Bacteroidia bacterium]MDW8416639.1 HlyD family efflux transporter periplasmic adaptor subunit [Bacteroidia bacterium]
MRFRLLGGFVSERIDEIGYAIGRTVEPPLWVRKGLNVLGVLGLLFFVFLFLPWTQNVSTVGQVTSLSPDVRPQTLHAMIPGRILRWYVQEGQRVKAGDTLLLIGEIKDYYLDPNLPQRLQEQLAAKESTAKAQETKIKALRRQIEALVQMRAQSIERAQNTLSQARLRYSADSAAYVAARVEYELTRNQYARQETLYAQGLRSLTDLQIRKQRFQEAEAKLIAAQNRLRTSALDVDNASIQLRVIENDFAEKIAKAESELRSAESYFYDVMASIAKLRNEISNVEVRRGFYAVVAPQDGYIVRAIKTGVGEVIKEGEPLTVFMPLAYRLAAELYVRPLDAALLRTGAKVRLQFDGWPAFIFSGWPRASFGTFGGRVYTIDYVDTGNGFFRVLVEPDPEDKPWPELLRLGGGVRGWFLLNDVPIWYEIWRQINGFPPDLIPQFYKKPSTNQKK